MENIHLNKIDNAPSLINRWEPGGGLSQLVIIRLGGLAGEVVAPCPLPVQLRHRLAAQGLDAALRRAHALHLQQFLYSFAVSLQGG